MQLKDILLNYVSLVAVTFVYYLILPAGNFSCYIVRSANSKYGFVFEKAFPG
ncbi:hypothetical protein LPAF129_18190 [Ligilactobacillus pabuli]|uniref:Uncharacterized protein n=1 Tax=Ligilactobacillus pabuli TaxID=2886039 RepID=A0ABQ5JJT7_9LACO|nr:hypothetical protein [Ligilactobacillus pabuli]GKS82133.1 hypothetical protein LPAF129_18190 [Ligilactobacillus pabuli]HIW89435.1 hypothetical protein [Candidatus Ligilactobacillus excrementipullorum]